MMNKSYIYIAERETSSGDMTGEFQVLYLREQGENQFLARDLGKLSETELRSGLCIPFENGEPSEVMSVEAITD